MLSFLYNVLGKVEWFYISKETKGHSGRRIRFLNNFIQLSMQCIITIRTSRSQMFFEIGIFKVCNIHWSLFLVKLQAWRPINLLKRGSNTDISLWILQTYYENKKNTTGGFFCTWNSPGISFYKSGNWWDISSI